MNQDNAYLKQTLNLAYDAIKKKNYEKGKTLLEKVISINSEMPGVYNDLGLLTLNIGDLDLAIQHFEKAIKIIGILLAFFVITFFSSIYFYNKSKYTKELEKDVGVRTKKINELTKRYKQIFEN